MSLGEFIMENIDWINLVIAAITLAGVVITSIMTIYNLCKSEKTTRELLKADHEGLFKDHERLSKDSEGLSKEHEGLSKEHTNLKEQQKEIKNMISFVRDKALLDEEKNKNLSMQMLDIKKTSEHISALVDLVQTTSAENQKLTEENQKLTEKNQELINLIKDLSREQEMEM